METVIDLLWRQESGMIYNALPRTLQPGYRFGPHCHKNVEICMMTEGECDIEVNGETITVRPGEMMVIFPHMIHSFHMRSRRAAHFLQMHFQPESIRWEAPEAEESIKFLSYMRDEHSVYLLQPFSQRLRICVEHICAETGGEEALHEALSQIYIYEMIFLLSREIAQGFRRIFTLENPVVIRAVQYISDRMEGRTTLTDVANHCRVTTRHLSKVFRESLNITVNDYISIGKVDRAMQFLLEGQLTLAQIAERLGFSSTQYLSTVFKKYTRVTPKEFRTMSKKEV